MLESTAGFYPFTSLSQKLHLFVEFKKSKTVDIAKPENVGTNMCIDDKEINHKSLTIMSNQDTGKITFVMDSVKSIELQKKGLIF